MFTVRAADVFRQKLDKTLINVVLEFVLFFLPWPVGGAKNAFGGPVSFFTHTVSVRFDY